jgi:class 3 adenylate cyclase
MAHWLWGDRPEQGKGCHVCGIAEPDEVLVTSTVQDLVAGSGLVFRPRGEHELKGAGTWTLFAVDG